MVGCVDGICGPTLVDEDVAEAGFGPGEPETKRGNNRVRARLREWIVLCARYADVASSERFRFGIRCVEWPRARICRCSAAGATAPRSGRISARQDRAGGRLESILGADDRASPTEHFIELKQESDPACDGATAQTVHIVEKTVELELTSAHPKRLRNLRDAAGIFRLPQSIEDGSLPVAHLGCLLLCDPDLGEAEKVPGSSKNARAWRTATFFQAQRP